MAMLMAVVMLCGMLPMTALAANATTIKVAGTELTETGYYTVTAGTVGSKQDTEPAGGKRICPLGCGQPYSHFVWCDS